MKRATRIIAGMACHFILLAFGASLVPAYAVESRSQKLNDKLETHLKIKSGCNLVGVLDFHQETIQNKESVERLFRAASTGDVKQVEELLKSGADVNSKDTKGKTPLFYAVISNHDNQAVITMLLNAGAYINAKDNNGATALGAAMDPPIGTLANVKTLLDHGADVNVSDARGWTPLMVAADWNNIPFLQLLLNNGADPNKSLPDGRTALMIAAVSYKTETIRVLLRHGANPKFMNSQGKTALSLARAAATKEKRSNRYIRNSLAQIIKLLEEAEKSAR